MYRKRPGCSFLKVLSGGSDRFSTSTGLWSGAGLPSVCTVSGGARVVCSESVCVCVCVCVCVRVCVCACVVIMMI